MIRLDNLTPLDVGAEFAFGVGLDDGAAKDFGVGFEYAGKDFAPDAREDFGPGCGSDGEMGIDGAICGSRSFHTPNAGCEGESLCSLSCFSTSRGREPLGTGWEGES